MKEMKRILSLVLCFVMVVGLLPMSVFATDYSIVADNERPNDGRAENDIVIEDGMVTEMTEILATPTVLDAAIFCSDVHGSTSDLTSVLGGVKTSGVDYSSIGFVGDTCLTVANTTSTVQSALGDTDIAVMFSYAASHDTEKGADISTNWDYSGEVENISKYYLVYTIRETDMQNNTTAEADFTTWYNGLTDAEKALPIFIMSHRPLHDRRDDNSNAADWYEVISAAAESSDIVFFWGHNHTGESSADTNAYYVAKDGTESFTVYNGSTVVPNFTYMNAGYINANNQNPARINVATTVQITADSLIFQDYTTSGTYTNSSYSHNVTVAREFASTKKVTAIEVAGETVYTVGGNGLNLTVTATYDDGTTADVTANSTFSPAELTASGVYTVTAAYEGFTDTIDVTVNLYAEDLNAYGDLIIAVEAFSQGATALEITWDDAADAILYEKGIYTDYVVYDLAVTNPGETTKYAMTIVDNMDMSNLVVYYVADDGTLTAVPYTVENDCIVFTTGLTGTFAYGAVAVPEGYTLASVTLENIPTDLFVGGSLDLLNAVITATYTKEGAEDFVRQLTVQDWDETNFSGYDVNVAGPQTAVFTFDGVTATLDIYVWGDEFTASDVTVSVDNEGSEYGVTGVNVTESTNENVASAIQYVITGDNYVAYDISLVYENGYSATEDVKTVTLPIPEGVTNPVVYYVSDSGKSVVDMKAINNGDGTVTFTTTHFSTYVVGEATEIEVPDPDTAKGSVGGKKTVYKLTTSISTGNDYLIVDTNSAGDANILARNGSSYSNTTATVVSDSNGTYIVLEDATDELWTYDTVTSGSGYWSETYYTFKNGDYYLYYTGSSSYNRSLALTTSTPSYSWSYSSNHLSIRSRYLTGGSSWSLSSTQSNVYFYVATEIDDTVSGTYSIDGQDETAAAVKGATINLTSSLVFTPTSGDATTTVNPEGVTYAVYEGGDPLGVISGISGNTVTLSGKVGKALVKVSYTTDFGVVTDYITITANAPHHYSIDLTDGAPDYNSITAPVALKGIKAGDTYSVWAVVKAHASADDETGVDLGALGNALSWSVSDTSIATIDTTTGVITFTGNNYGTFDVTVAYEGADGKVITDTITISVTDSLYVVPGDGTDDFPEYPNEGAVRFDKTATAVGNYSETGLALVELSMTGVPYTTGNELDVVLMLDMTGSMDDVSSSTSEPTGYVRIDATIAASKAFISTIVKNEDGTYNDNRIGVYVFNKNGAATLYDFGTVDSDSELEAIYADLNTIKDDHFASGGTPYDDGLAKCQEVLTAAKTDGIGNDHKQFCVFMTDGVPTSYAYVNGTSMGTHSSASAVAGMLTSGSNYATRDSDYKYEYYSTQMKAAGVTVYSVGVGLFNENNAWSGSATQCGNLASALLNDISGPANEASQPDAAGTATLSKKDSYFFSVDDADAGTEMSKIFKNIAVQILEAATDIVVEDKVGDKYSVNFSLPGYGTDNAVDPTALDGLGEFYIQVVDYVLDSTTHERTGTYTVLENFTFNFDGSLKSHTVDGVACSGCSHVTVTDGVITAIDGTYFDYKSDSTGEYLTWTAEKLTSTELALQYFAHLDNSTGVDEGDQVPAGTYYTNEYATLTYTNYNGNQVQQEFPVPQLTWYGAQVSYVFYLVNEAGQPVNRAGRVVPFAEAVYVTNVHTYSVVWNDLEQAAGLEAKYLADNVVPDVYELYDDDASYFVHVYADEEGVNLNNHFMIGGDVTDDYNATWTNAKTTYVFNNKSDGTKYNTVGAYIANDNSDSTNTTAYLCKGEGTVSGVVWTQVELTGDSDFVNGAYYYDVDGVKTRALNYTEGTTYYQLTGASYTAVSGETQWKPGEDDSTTGGTVIGGYVYYVDEYGTVYTIVRRSNGQEVYKGFDFANTTVAFAVVWKPELAADTVVVDYGLDVVIDVITNDSMAAGVKEVQAAQPNATINSGVYERDEALTTSVDVYIDANNDADGLKELKVGTATVENLNAVRFSLDKTNGMLFNKPAVFYYEADVNFYDEDGELTTASMYSSVTVIPATTVYYEDAYVNLQTVGIKYVNEVCEADSGKTYYVENDDGAHTSVTNPVVGETYLVQQYTYTDGWAVEGTAINKQQQQDRPGASKISENLDADNSYGYDDAYNSMSQYSMGSAAKITVNENTFGTATFTFCGTGFDVISLTSSATGTILVEVKDATGKTVKNGIVDTYYGYSQNEEGDWVVDAGDTALFQVPVIKYFGMDYGTYTVTITAAYNQFFDHTSGDSYDLYLDAIRVYDPTGNESDAANKAYAADGEYMPSYFELRDKIIPANSFNTLTGDDAATGIVFIDGGIANPSIEDYTNYGPNNELYLASGQSIAFDLSVEGLKDKAGNVLANYETVVRIGLKSVGGTAAVAGLWKAEGGKKVGEMTVTLNTATDMYYDISALPGGTVVITNTGAEGSILSITNIKVSYRFNGNAEDLANPDDVENPNVVFTVTKETVEQAVATLPIEQVFVPIEVEIVEQPVTPGKPLKPVQPGKPSVPALPELPTDPVKPIRSIQKAAVSVSFEETVVGSRRVIG